MSHIKDLKSDIEQTLSKGTTSPTLSTDIEESLGKLRDLLLYKLSPDSKKENATLRMSNIGMSCGRQLWYRLNKPEKAEEIRPETYLKFLYGDIVEWLMLLLARVSGHKVEGQQSTLEYDGVVGHRDAIIDGHLVDVKSASRFAFEKFKGNKVPSDDSFGYMDQLSLYHHASKPELEDTKQASFLAVNKENGDFVLDTYPMPDRDWSKEIAEKKAIVLSPDPPPRGYQDVPYGKSGNKALSTVCSYCSFKNECYPGLRTFIYSGKPVFLTTVVREPDVYEVK